MTKMKYSEEVATESPPTATAAIEQSMADLTEQMAALTAAWARYRQHDAFVDSLTRGQGE